MKTKLLKGTAAGVALAAVITLLGACATSPTASVRRPARDSSAPLHYTLATPERNIPVVVRHDWTPFDEL